MEKEILEEPEDGPEDEENCDGEWTEESPEDLAAIGATYLKSKGKGTRGKDKGK